VHAAFLSFGLFHFLIGSGCLLFRLLVVTDPSLLSGEGLQLSALVFPDRILSLSVVWNRFELSVSLPAGSAFKTAMMGCWAKMPKPKGCKLERSVGRFILRWIPLSFGHYEIYR